MIVRRIRNDELTHYGVKGMKWKHHKAKPGTWKDNLGGGHSSGGGSSYEDDLKDRNKAKRNLRAIEQTKRKAEEVKNSFGKSEKAESMKKDVQERIDKYLTKGEKSDRHRLNSKRKNRENTGKKQINDLKDKRSKEKDKRNSMWALQKSYNRAAKETRKETRNKDEQQKAWKFQKEWQRSHKNKRKYS